MLFKPGSFNIVKVTSTTPSRALASDSACVAGASIICKSTGLGTVVVKPLIRPVSKKSCDLVLAWSFRTSKLGTLSPPLLGKPVTEPLKTLNELSKDTSAATAGLPLLAAKLAAPPVVMPLLLVYGLTWLMPPPVLVTPSVPVAVVWPSTTPPVPSASAMLLPLVDTAPTKLFVELDRLFDLQGEIALKIAAQLATPTGVVDRLARQKAQSGSAYAAVLRFYAYTEQFTPDLHRQAKVELLAAVKSAPLYAEAWACLSGVYWNEHLFGFNASTDITNPLDKSIECAKHALKLAPESVTGTYALAVALFQKGELDLFREYAQKTLEMAPYRADLIAGIGYFKAHSGEWTLGLSLMDRARELAPFHPDWYWIPYASDAYLREDYSTALQYAKRVNVASFPFFRLYTAAISHRLQMPQEASESLSALNAMVPNLVDDLDNLIWRFLSNETMHKKMLSDILMIYRY